MPKWAWAPTNWWAFVQPETVAIAFDLERGLLVLITPTAGGLAFGTIPTDTLVAAAFPGGARRFGAVSSTEVVNPAAGARRWGAVPSDEQVPDPWV